MHHQLEWVDPIVHLSSEAPTSYPNKLPHHSIFWKRGNSFGIINQALKQAHFPFSQYYDPPHRSCHVPCELWDLQSFQKHLTRWNSRRSSQIALSGLRLTLVFLCSRWWEVNGLWEHPPLPRRRTHPRTSPHMGHFAKFSSPIRSRSSRTHLKPEGLFRRI